MASTIITTNAAALARIADQLVDSYTGMSKNRILNIIAGAIAGPGNDWGYIKKAPSGHFVQPGLTQEPTGVTTPEVWCLKAEYDEKHPIRLFSSKDKALSAVQADFGRYLNEHAPSVTEESVLEALSKGDAATVYPLFGRAVVLTLLKTEIDIPVAMEEVSDTPSSSSPRRSLLSAALAAMTHQNEYVIRSIDEMDISEDIISQGIFITQHIWTIVSPLIEHNQEMHARMNTLVVDAAEYWNDHDDPFGSSESIRSFWDIVRAN